MKTTLLNIDPAHVLPLVKPWPVEPGLAKLLKIIQAQGGKAILVGGCVRDHLLGLVPKDLDLEVYGLEPQELEEALAKNFIVLPVGKSFGIYKVIVQVNQENRVYDVAVPRLDNKSGSGHKGFIVSHDPFMSFSDAAIRRDFTVNAMGIDLCSQTLLDPHGGFKDLKLNLLRHVSKAFKEDPLRVLRAAQFCARFGFTLDPQTVDLCRSLKEELRTLSRERIYEEMKKLLLAKEPERGLEVLRSCEALLLFPELQALIGCKQEPTWHPEGDVWIHTLMVVKEARKLCESLPEDEQLVVMAGALCHDLGKPPTTCIIDGKIKSIAHDQAGVPLTHSFLERLGFPPKYFSEVSDLVREHLKPFQLYAKRDEVSDGAIRRLCMRVNIKHLLLVSQADFLGRTTPEALSRVDPSAHWLDERIKQLLGNEVSIKPLLLGRHLIALGMKPGPHFSQILHSAFELQLDGLFNTEDQAILWLKEYIKTAN